MKIKIYHLKAQDEIPTPHDSQGRRVRVVKYTAQSDGHFVMLEGRVVWQTSKIDTNKPKQKTVHRVGSRVFKV